MGSLATHFSAFLFLFPIGIRRLLCCFSLYLKNPYHYRSKTWYLSDPRWKTIDLYILLIALPIASFSEIFLFLSFSGHPTYRFTFFQQSVMILMFWVLLVLVILRENIDPSLINEGFLFIFAGISFVLEYSLMGKEITGPGIPGVRVYELLSGLTLVCAASCFYLSLKPTAFFAEVVLSSALVFKGTWILQAGLSLYTDTFSLKGCRKISLLPAHEQTNAQCNLEEDGLRGVALIDLLFIGHAIGILVICLVLFGTLSCNRNWISGSGSSLADIDSESLLIRPLPEVELE
ncbi:hypothetical protein FRX31_027012 [Thalictrum thalictroides]|uniref:Transmembrane protein n=1 Tax=Thalictrum thalictroides TaxID=46969 RepID=A0A7J6VGI9_THATH|nr:hypothetical protein FRX31_027012 [Thalictrum thalictroides]